MFKVLLKLFKKIRQKRSLSIIGLEIKVCNRHGFNQMTDTASHNFTAFATIQLGLLNIRYNITDSGSNLRPLRHDLRKIVLGRYFLIHLCEFAPVVRVSNQLYLFDRQRFESLVQGLPLIDAGIARETD